MIMQPQAELFEVRQVGNVTLIDLPAPERLRAGGGTTTGTEELDSRFRGNDGTEERARASAAPTEDQGDPAAGSDTQTRFQEWVHTPAGAEVANHFIRLAYGLWRRGFKHYGSKGIVERLRWHYNLKYARISPANGEEFKINNNWTARLARFAEEKEPRLKDFFEKRKTAV